MILGHNTFPQRDVTADEAEFITQIWGAPRLQRHHINFFLNSIGRPILSSDTRQMTYVGLAMASTSDALEVNRRDGSEAFMTGALLYTSVYNHLTAASRLPISVDAMRDVGNGEAIDFVLATRDSLRESHGIFCGLLDRILPYVDVPPRLKDLALVGAGALHVAMEETFSPSGALGDMETAPELEDLRALFDSFGDTPS